MFIEACAVGSTNVLHHFIDSSPGVTYGLHIMSVEPKL